MEKKKDELNLLLKDIEVNNSERAIAKCHYPQFAKYCYWLLLRFSDEKENMFYARELSKFAKISHSASYRFFEDLANLGYIIPISIGTFKHYSLVMNSDKPKLYELLDYIKRTILKYKK